MLQAMEKWVQAVKEMLIKKGQVGTVVTSEVCSEEVQLCDTCEAIWPNASRLFPPWRPLIGRALFGSRPWRRPILML